jgi:hypothetical protein
MKRRYELPTTTSSYVSDLAELERDALNEIASEINALIVQETCAIVSQLPTEIWLRVLHLAIGEGLHRAAYRGWLFTVPLVSKKMASVAYLAIRECFAAHPLASRRVFRYFCEDVRALSMRFDKMSEFIFSQLPSRATCLTALSLFRCQISNWKLTQLTQLTNLALLGIEEINARSLAALTNLVALRDYRVEEPHNCDAYLSVLTKLESLDLGDVQHNLGLSLQYMTGLRALRLPMLEMVGFNNNAGGHSLPSMLSNLRALSLSLSKGGQPTGHVSPIWIEHTATLFTQLTELDLSHYPESPASREYYRFPLLLLDGQQQRHALTNLVVLSIEQNTDITDEDICGMTGLRELYCTRTDISDHGVSTLTSLRVLSCRKNYRITGAGLSHLTALELLDCRRSYYHGELTTDAFSLLTGLKILLTKGLVLAGALTHLTSLQYVHLGWGNDFEKIRDRFGPQCREMTCRMVEDGCRELSYVFNRKQADIEPHNRSLTDERYHFKV